LKKVEKIRIDNVYKYVVDIKSKYDLIRLGTVPVVDTKVDYRK
jgi:hypothetical protein